MTLELYKIVHEGGWDALSPSADCLREREIVLHPNDLSADERMFVHAYILIANLLRRFWKHIDSSQSDEQMPTIQKCAFMHAMQVAGRELTPSTFAPAYEAFVAWHFARLAPSGEAYEAAAKRATAIDDIDRASCEPAYTLWRTVFGLGWTDYAGDKRALAVAMRLVEARGVRPEHREAAPLAACTEMDVYQVLSMLTDQNSGRAIFEVTEEGKFRMRPRSVRDGLEKLAGEVEPVSQEPTISLTALSDDAEGAEFDLPDDASNDHAKEAEVADLLEAIRIWRDARSAVSTDEVELLVLANWERLRAEEVTVLGLAEESGIGRKRIERTIAVLATAFAARAGM